MPDVQYVQGDTKVDNTEWLTAGVTDFDFNMPSMHIRTIESGAAIKILTGVHTGCWELRANESVAGIADLKGKRVGIWGFDDHPQILLSLMVNYVGLDAARDIEWVDRQTLRCRIHRGQGRCLPPRCFGSSREARTEEHRAYDRQQ